MNAVQSYIMHLLKCAVSSKKADYIPNNICLADLFAYSKQEQIENLVYTALPYTDREPQIMHKFSQCYEKAIVRESKQTLELEMISDALTASKIKHIPLKGSVIKYMYPSPDLRQSGDIDILADTHDGIDKIMTKLGFNNEYLQKEKHSSYRRGKMHIEIHSFLDYSSSSFCNKVWNNVNLINGTRYEMMPEFLYVYLLVHLRSHILGGGAGIKLILDLYVFNKKNCYDREKVNSFAKEAGVYNLMSYAEALCSSWFDGVPITDANISILENLILNSPVYGSFETYLKIQYSSSSKIKNIFKMVFLPYEKMTIEYPVLKKYSILLPLMWVRRIIRRLITRDGHLAAIKNHLSSIDNKELEKYISFKESISN